MSASTAVDDGFGWVAGIYALRLTEAGRSAMSLWASCYAAARKRLRRDEPCGVRRGGMAPGTRDDLSAGLRVEGRSASYSDSDGAELRAGRPHARGTVSLRGEPPWRAGTSPRVAATRRAGSTSASCPRGSPDLCARVPVDLEGGRRLATADAAVEGELSLFHMWRDDQQVATSFQVDPATRFLHLLHR